MTNPDKHSKPKLSVVGQYDINEHIKFVLGVLRPVEHETWGLRAALEAISFHLPDTFHYSPEFFVSRFGKFLEKNDVVENATAGEVYALSERIIAKTGRNYRLIELVAAFDVMLRAWEVQEGSLE